MIRVVDSHKIARICVSLQSLLCEQQGLPLIVRLKHELLSWSQRDNISSLVSLRNVWKWQSLFVHSVSFPTTAILNRCLSLSEHRVSLQLLSLAVNRVRSPFASILSKYIVLMILERISVGSHKRALCKTDVLIRVSLDHFRVESYSHCVVIWVPVTVIKLTSLSSTIMYLSMFVFWTTGWSKSDKISLPFP